MENNSIVAEPVSTKQKLNKTVLRKVRFRPDELELLDAFLAELGISFSQFVRDAVALRQSIAKATHKKRVPTSPPPEVDPALLLELGRIGTNINQIARSLNILKNDESHSDLRSQFSFTACLQVLQRMLQELHVVTGELPKITRTEQAVQKARMKAISRFLPEVERDLEES